MRKYILILVIILLLFSVGWITHVKNWWMEDSVITSSTINSTSIGSSSASTIAGTTVSASTSITGNINVGTATGSDAITLSVTPSFASYSSGMTVFFIADSANTTATTINVCGLGAKSIKEAYDNSALDANDIKAGMGVLLLYDGTNFQQISQSGN